MEGRTVVEVNVIEAFSIWFLFAEYFCPIWKQEKDCLRIKIQHHVKTSQANIEIYLLDDKMLTPTQPQRQFMDSYIPSESDTNKTTITRWKSRTSMHNVLTGNVCKAMYMYIHKNSKLHCKICISQAPKTSYQ